MQVRITKPNEPERLFPWNENDVDGNNAKLEAYNSQIKFGGYNNEGEVMQVDLVHDDGKTVIKTIAQHEKMRMLSTANKVQEFQKSTIASQAQELENMRKLLEVEKANNEKLAKQLAENEAPKGNSKTKIPA